MVADGIRYLQWGLDHRRRASVRVLTTEEAAERPPDPALVDFYLETARLGWGGMGYPKAPIVHTIGRAGAVFTTIRSPRAAGRGG